MCRCFLLALVQLLGVVPAFGQDKRPTSTILFVRVVTFGYRLPFPDRMTTGKLEDWQDVPSTSEDYERARTTIVNKIDALIKTLTPNEVKDSSRGRK